MAITKAQLQRAGYVIDGDSIIPASTAPQNQRSKFGNIPTIYDGRRYASKAEAGRAAALDSLQLAGIIASWKPQPRFELGVPENIYIADFLVRDVNGKVWVEDVKGIETEKFKRDKKLWRSYGPHPLHIIKKGYTAEVVPGGKDRP